MRPKECMTRAKLKLLLEHRVYTTRGGGLRKGGTKVIRRNDQVPLRFFAHDDDEHALLSDSDGDDISMPDDYYRRGGVSPSRCRVFPQAPARLRARPRGFPGFSSAASERVSSAEVAFDWAPSSKLASL